MHVKVSKTFVKFMNKTGAEKGVKFNAIYTELEPRIYSRFVGSTFDNWDDYNHRTGKYKAIRVEYPDEYFALSRFVTTKQLNDACKQCGVNDAEGLKALIIDLCEI